jgi:LytR cell envelope-related transcriptional attenuator
VDAPLTLPPALARWHRATLVAVGIAVAEGIVIVVAGALLLGPKLVHHVKNAAIDAAAAAPRQSIAPPPAHARLARADTSVLVLNGNGRVGAAQTAAGEVKARGYTIGGVGNAPRSDYSRTLVMYRPGFRGEAIRLRHDLHRGLVSPLDGMSTRALMGAHLVLVLGN